MPLPQSAFPGQRQRLTHVGAAVLIAVATACPGLTLAADSAAGSAPGVTSGSMVPPAVLRAWGSVSAAVEGQLSKVRAGRVTAPEPQPSTGAIETWGDEPASSARPARPTKAGERRSAAPPGRVPQEDLELDSSMQTRDVHYGRRALDEPRVDTDDRLRDERAIGDRRAPTLVQLGSAARMAQPRAARPRSLWSSRTAGKTAALPGACALHALAQG